MQVLNCEQGSAEWLQARCGIITASDMSKVLAKGQGKTRAKYMHGLIAERFTGLVTGGYFSADMERGKMQEPVAREIYEARTGYTVQEVGFVINHGVGYSPDGLIGDDGLLEIKTRNQDLQVELLLADRVPPEHTAQIQAGLWVTGRKWIDFVSYCPGLPLFYKRVFPDAEYIETMQKECEDFYVEMEVKIAKLKGLSQ